MEEEGNHPSTVAAPEREEETERAEPPSSSSSTSSADKINNNDKGSDDKNNNENNNKKKDEDEDSDDDELITGWHKNSVTYAMMLANPQWKAMQIERKRKQRIQKQLQKRRNDPSFANIDPLEREYLTFEIERRPIRHPVR